MNWKLGFEKFYRQSTAPATGNLEEDAMNEQEWREYFEHSTYLPIRAAAQGLKQGLSALGLTASPNTGHVPAVRFHDGYNRYLFSFILNKTSLLFYIRLPALQESSLLASHAKLKFTEVNTNSAGETTIRITSPADAEAVVQWLSAVLPLPYTQ